MYDRSLFVALFLILAFPTATLLAQEAPGYDKLTKEAIALASQGKLDEAIVAAREANRVAVEFAGADSWIAAISGSNLGEMLRRKGATQEAKTVLERAIAAGTVAEGSTETMLASMKNSLAVVYVSLGDLEGAEALYNENIATFNKLGMTDSEELALVMNDAAELYRRKGDTTTAERMYKESIGISEKNGRATTIFMGYRYTNYGLLLAEKNQFAEATQYMEKGIAILQDSLPADSPDLTNTQLNLAQVLANQAFTVLSTGDYASAEPPLSKSIKIFERVQPDNPNLSQIYDAYSMILFQLDRLDEAKVYKDKAKVNE